MKAIKHLVLFAFVVMGSHATALAQDTITQHYDFLKGFSVFNVHVAVTDPSGKCGISEADVIDRLEMEGIAVSNQEYPTLFVAGGTMRSAKTRLTNVSIEVLVWDLAKLSSGLKGPVTVWESKFNSLNNGDVASESQIRQNCAFYFNRAINQFVKDYHRAN